MLLSEASCVLKLIKNKDALQEVDPGHYDIVFNPEACVSQQNFSFDYLTTTYNNIIPKMR